MYQKALEIEPDDLNIHRAIAQLYLDRKQYKKALVKLNEIERQAPDDLAVKLRIALIYYEMKDFKSATEKFEAILKENPDADKIRYYLGILHESMKNYAKATQELSKVPPQSSFFKDAQLHIASLHRMEGRVDGAIDSLKGAIAAKNDVSEFYEFLAALLEEQKRYDEVVSVLEQGRKVLPQNEKIIFLLGIIYEKLRERGKALDAMRAVLDLNPQNASALNYIGYSYAESGEHLDEAKEMIEKALVLRPGDGYITDSLGWVYFKKGDLDKSFEYLMKADRLSPNEPTILNHLGEVYLRRGDTIKALEYFERAYDIGSKKPEPDEEEMEGIKEKIEKLKGK
jgi:tetratricopeptide (TPR) repeat protein